MDRQCARPGCSEPAVATISYSYGRRIVWLAPLTAERQPSDHDLCGRHALRLAVPRGWALEDLRAPRALDRSERPERADRLDRGDRAERAGRAEPTTLAG
jgi:hypothetical protein